MNGDRGEAQQQPDDVGAGEERAAADRPAAGLAGVENVLRLVGDAHRARRVERLGALAQPRPARLAPGAHRLQPERPRRPSAHPRAECEQRELHADRRAARPAARRGSSGGPDSAASISPSRSRARPNRPSSPGPRARPRPREPSAWTPSRIEQVHLLRVHEVALVEAAGRARRVAAHQQRRPIAQPTGWARRPVRRPGARPSRSAASTSAARVGAGHSETCGRPSACTSVGAATATSGWASRYAAIASIAPGRTCASSLRNRTCRPSARASARLWLAPYPARSARSTHLDLGIRRPDRRRRAVLGDVVDHDHLQPRSRPRPPRTAHRATRGPNRGSRG